MTNKEAIDGLQRMRIAFFNSRIDGDMIKPYLDVALDAIAKQEADRWIPFSKDFDKDYGMELLQSPLPDDEQEILVTDGKNVWIDTFIRDGQICYLDSNSTIVDEVVAWRPKPFPPNKE